MIFNSEKIFRKAINIYGEKMQLVVATEELSELIKEITKLIRGKGNPVNLVEEIADVRIMIRQLMMICDITDKEVNDEINFKILRLNDILDHEKD